MPIHFLFPAHPLKSSTIDERFAEQITAFRDAGFSTSLCPDAVIQHGKPLRNIPPGATVVYRGWMLNAAEYSRLAEAITAASASPLTPPATYLLAHHLPNWHPLIAELTPETRVLPVTTNVEAELRALGWEAFFIKDYVKSLKTSRGSIIRDPSQIAAVVEEMMQFRGEIEGGLCVRRVEAFVPNTERRYFVLYGKSYSADGETVPELVHRVAERIPSPFFSVDIIRRDDAVLRVV
jgi:hypothetical protein